jgi:hypothetical protein
MGKSFNDDSVLPHAPHTVAKSTACAAYASNFQAYAQQTLAKTHFSTILLPHAPSALAIC